LIIQEYIDSLKGYAEREFLHYKNIFLKKVEIATGLGKNNSDCQI